MFFFTFILLSKKNKKQKNPNAKIANLRLKEAKGDPCSIITFPVIKAEDHNIIKVKDKMWII